MTISERKLKENEAKTDNWFENTSFPETGVTAIGEPLHSEEVFCYLVEGRDADLLIDTGMGVSGIQSHVNQLRNPFKPLIVVNTHWHFDHIGGNSDFPKVYIPADQDEIRGIVRGWSPKDLARYDVSQGFNEIPLGFDPENYRVDGYTNILPVLSEGTNINLGDRTIEVISTPGHTPGSICLFDRENGILFTSDLLYQGPLYCFEDESSPRQYEQSLRKLNAMQGKVKVIHPGHNYPSNSPELIDQALEVFAKISTEQPDEVTSDYAVYKHPTVPRLAVYIHPKFVQKS